MTLTESEAESTREEGNLLHASELRPDLSEDTNVQTVDHVGLEELEVVDISILALEFAHVLNLLKLDLNKSVIAVTLAVDECENIVAVLPAILTC